MRYKFGLYEVNTNEFCLKENGLTVAIEPKVFDVIVYLVSHADRVITRQEFFDQLWAGIEVSDATLSNHIRIARTALGDNGHAQSVIKTVHGRGYQFVAPLVLKEEEHRAEPESKNPRPSAAIAVNTTSHLATPHSKSNRLVFCAITLLTVAVIFLAFNQFGEAPAEAPRPVLNRSIAVLPFKNTSEHNEDKHFADGIHGDLLTQISKLRDIKTISKTSVLTYRDTDKSPTEIGNELLVKTLLEGSVQRSGEQIRIKVQLIETQTNTQLWAESYTRSLSAENIFAIQSDIATAIAAELKVVMPPATKDRLPTHNLAALEAYFFAKSASLNATRTGYDEAIQHLEQAITLDPQFKIAHAELAILYLGHIYWAGQATEAQIAKAQPLINHALAMDDETSEAYTALAVLRKHQQRHQDAERAFDRAIALNPNNDIAMTEFALFSLWTQRKTQRAINLFQRAHALNPKDDAILTSLAQALTDAGLLNEALLEVKNIIQRRPDFAKAYRAKSDIYFWKGFHLAESQRALSQNLKFDPGVPFNAIVMTMTYLMTDDQALALGWLKYGLTLAPEHKTALGLMAHIEGRDAEAFKLFFDQAISPIIPIYLYDIVGEGIRLGQSTKLIAKYKAETPRLFEVDAIIDASNFVQAIAVARLLKTQGDSKQASYLLEKSLEVLQTPPYGGWITSDRNWKTRVYIALGNYELAATTFAEWVEAGQGSLTVVSDPVYQPLNGLPVFDKALKTMIDYIQAERTRLRTMEASGEIQLPPVTTL